MHIQKGQRSLRDELCVVEGELREVVVQVEVPHVHVGLIGIWPKRLLCGRFIEIMIDIFHC